MKRPWLAPLSPLYAAGVALRNWRIDSGREPVRRLRWPVMSVGSLSAGGAGKTPTTIALAKALAEKGFAVDVLSRGYGRTSRAAARVLPDGAAEEFGDEPLLIALNASVPVYVAAQRYDAGQLAERDAIANEEMPHGPRVHILDDGFQHRQLHRDVDVLLASLEDWRDKLLPAGNLREALSAANRADVIAIPADEPTLERELRAWGWEKPIWKLRRIMDVPAVNGPAAAFCGIARPEQFFRGLESAGLRIASRAAFQDHYRFSVGDVERMVAAARAAGAGALVTTEKDSVRLGAAAEEIRKRMPLLTVGLRVEIEDDAIRWLAERLGKADLKS